MEVLQSDVRRDGAPMNARGGRDGACVLGIDGGGTSTRALLARCDGRVLAEGRGGPGNVQAVGAEAARVSLKQAIDAALAAAGPAMSREGVATAVAGLAGVHVAADYERMTDLLQALLPTSAVRIHNDGEVALVGATGAQPGVAVVAGTGSIAYGMDRAGHYLRCGGWGYLIGDEGGAYAITLAALRAAGHACDGRAPATSLVPALCSALGVADFDAILRPIYGPPALTRYELAALAPVVARCAAAGDTAARAILRAAGEDLAELAVTLLRRLDLADLDCPVAYIGSVWTAGETVLEPFQTRIAARYPRAAVRRPLLEPAAGAALLAIAMATGASTSHPDVLENLRSTHLQETNPT